MDHVIDCIWSRSTPDFQDAHEASIFCIELSDDAKKAGYESDEMALKRKLVQSDTFFAGTKKVVDLHGASPLGIGEMKSYLLAAASPRSGEGLVIIVT
jgi:hypothetical protein